MGGTDIQKNGKNVIPSDELREITKWEGGLNGLVAMDLVVTRGHKGDGLLKFKI